MTIRIFCLLVVILPTGCMGLRQSPSQRRPDSVAAPTRMQPLAITAPVRDPARAESPDPSGKLLPRSASIPIDQEPLRVAEPVNQVRGQMPQSKIDPSTTQPITPTSLHGIVSERWRTMDSFEARLTRREVVGGKPAPTEIMLFRFRKDPFSVRFKWLGEEGKGRESVFVQGQHGDQLHILTAPGDIPFSRKASRMTFSPDSPLVRGRSRRHIREAGFGLAIDSLGKALQKGPNAVRMLGNVQRPEYTYPLTGVEFSVAPGEDTGLPKGGRRQMFFDLKPGSTSYGLPVVAISYDEAGKEVEYYAFDRMIYPIRFDDQDFHPDTLGR